MPSGWVAVQFDNRTASIVGALAAFSVSALSALLWHTRRTYPGFTRWILGNCCACLSLAALAVRGMVPDWLSVIVANGGAFSGAALLLEGSRAFANKSATCAPARILVVLGMVAQICFVLVF